MNIELQICGLAMLIIFFIFIEHDRKLTVKDAIERYISSKEGVLSPSTIYGYRRMQRNRYESIEQLKVQELTSEDMQNR